MKMTVGVAKNVTEIPKMIQGNMYWVFGYLVVDILDFNCNARFFIKFTSIFSRVYSYMRVRGFYNTQL